MRSMSATDANAAPQPGDSRAPALICLCACPDASVAARIAETLVSDQLAACVNQLAPMRSVYRWQGRVEQASETLLLIKTTSACFPALRQRIVAMHPYELSEVVAVEITTGLPAYLDWIAAHCIEPSLSPGALSDRTE